MFGLDPVSFWIVIAVTLFSGFVKGAVGFAMPMIMMSALGSFLTAQQALAVLILPTLFTNIGQAFRQELAAGTGFDPGVPLAYRHGDPVHPADRDAGAGGAASGDVCAAGRADHAVVATGGTQPCHPIHHRRRIEIVSGIIGRLYGGISRMRGRR